MRRGGCTFRRARPGAFALIIVLLSLSVLAMILAGVQAVSFRQAASGRETLARFRAYWAARGGVECTLARLEATLQSGNTGSAYAIPDDMAQAATGSLDGATWRITHALPGRSAEARDGPADPHAKVNINLMTRDDLLQLESMTEDVADSILDWIDEDDTPNALGAEAGYYSQLPSPYEPRNGPMRSLFELELVAGVESDLVRGEDWNLDGVLDPNEDDGDESWPPDNADGVLDAGWSAYITASSWEPALAVSGQSKLNLVEATSDDLIARVSTLDPLQAQTILGYAGRAGARLEDFISTNLSQIAGQGSPVRNLRDDQLRALFEECTFIDPKGEPSPGRININTVTRETLDYVTAIPPGVADSLILARDAAPTGFTNMMDLLEVPSMSPRRVTTYSSYLTVEAGSYVLTSTGRDEASGMEARLTCVVSTGVLPVSIVEQRVR
ncbi:MAG: general secretion pathway protein GspK [Phycisphaerae bacterium]|nr:general secretion pathway protein GspK [Phycisphaerae bacterium]